MKIADCFSAAVAVAEQNCREWIFLGNGDVFHADELHEIAKEFDEKMPLEEEDFLAVTDDGSIGLLFPGCKEPDWFFVSPEFAVVNVLQEDINDYLVPADDGKTVAGERQSTIGRSAANGAAFASGIYGGIAGGAMYNDMKDGAAGNATEAGMVFCKNCGAQIKAGSTFCMHCGAKNSPAFCSNCGAKLEAGSSFCGNCGTKV